MTKAQLENRVNDVLTRVTARQPIEDSHVECKTMWPADIQRAARQIAGSANAARWEPVLWVIGVDERNASIPGADDQELSNWHAQVQAEFDGAAPALLMSIAVRWNSVTVVALLFETDRPPYVVKVGPGRMEVPWRAGNGTRSAYRAELLGMLLPTQKAPDIEIIRGRITLDAATSPNLVVDEKPPFRWSVDIQMYIVPRTDDRIVVPFHRCSVIWHLPNDNWRPFKEFRLIPFSWHSGSTSSWRDPHPTLQATDTEIIIAGPGMVALTGAAIWPREHLEKTFGVTVKISLAILGLEQLLTSEMQLGVLKWGPEKSAVWAFGQPGDMT